MDFSTFKRSLAKIRDRGFIKTRRAGNTGVGHTLEQELGLEENCISAPDLDEEELKARRRGAGGKQTLYSLEGEWVVSKENYIANYGLPCNSHDGEMSGNCTITKTVNNRDLSIKTTDDYCSVVHDDTVIVKWSWNTLVDQFAKKFPACVSVIADVEWRKGVEYFHYNEAFHLVGTDKNRFRTAIEDNLISIDTRMRTQNLIGKGIRNRGTAFRINHDDMEQLFVKENIDF